MAVRLRIAGSDAILIKNVKALRPPPLLVQQWSPADRLRRVSLTGRCAPYRLQIILGQDVSDSQIGCARHSIGDASKKSTDVCEARARLWIYLVRRCEPCQLFRLGLHQFSIGK
jgi:hypothetical protein